MYRKCIIYTQFSDWNIINKINNLRVYRENSYFVFVCTILGNMIHEPIIEFYWVTENKNTFYFTSITS